MGNLLFELRGNMNNLFVYEDKIIFKFLTDEKVIDKVDIESVEFSKASIWKNGYLSLGVKGEIKNSNGIRGAANDLRSIVFFPKQNELAENVYNHIRTHIEENKKNMSTIINQFQSFSSADELRKFKQLLDDGIITQEEFDEKKKQLLES